MAVYKKGMDADAVSASGDKLVGYKGELDGIVEAVNGAVQTIKGNWGGQDAEQFQSDWNGQRQVQEVSGGSGFSAQNDRRLHVGLGTSTTVDAVEIRWPSGRTQTIDHPEIDRVLHVTEPR